MSEPKKPSEEEDVLMMGPDLGGDQRPFYRKNNEGIHAGVLRPVKEGENLTEDAVYLEHQGPGPLYKVTPIFEKSGPRSKPATSEYREGWDRIFGGKSAVGQA